MSWFLVIRRMRKPFAEWKDRVPAHLAWLGVQHDEGTIILSGPSQDMALGLFVMRTTDHDAAVRTAHGDPLAADGLAEVEVIDWQLHQILGIGSFDATTLVADDPPPSA